MRPRCSPSACARCSASSRSVVDPWRALAVDERLDVPGDLGRRAIGIGERRRVAHALSSPPSAWLRVRRTPSSASGSGSRVHDDEPARRTGEHDVEEAQAALVTGHEVGRLDHDDVVELEALHLERVEHRDRVRRVRRPSRPRHRRRRAPRRDSSCSSAGATTATVPSSAADARACRGRGTHEVGRIHLREARELSRAADRSRRLDARRGGREHAVCDVHDLGRRAVVDRERDHPWRGAVERRRVTASCSSTVVPVACALRGDSPARSRRPRSSSGTGTAGRASAIASATGPAPRRRARARTSAARRSRRSVRRRRLP